MHFVRSPRRHSVVRLGIAVAIVIALSMVLKPIYERTDLVNKAVETAVRALIEGSLLVAVILFLFLGEVRSALVVIVTLPLAMLIAFIGMTLFPEIFQKKGAQLVGIHGVPGSAWPRWRVWHWPTGHSMVRLLAAAPMANVLRRTCCGSGELAFCWRRS